MDKEFINQINTILNQEKMDERIKPLIKLYFLGKLKTGNVTLEQLKSQIDTLCSRIPNVEFSSNNIITAYSDKAGVLTINKELFLEGKSSEILLPLFMKFEQALNQNNRKNYANHVEDFVRAGRIAKASSIPISDRLYKLYEMAEYCYGDIEHQTDEIIENDGDLQYICSDYNESLNKMIITGKDNLEGLLNGARLFHNQVFTEEAFSNPNFEGIFKNENYQKKAARVLSCIDYKDSENNSLNRTIRNIKLFTGCTQEMVEQSKSSIHTGDSRINTILKSTMQTHSSEISEEFIASKVQAVIDRKPDWDSRIKHLIIPFFIRSQKIYDWNIDEFQERLNEIDLNIDQIIFEDLGSITCMGDTGMNQIKLNSRTLIDKKRKFVIIFCNENSFSRIRT